jgi:ribosomal protein L29
LKTKKAEAKKLLHELRKSIAKRPSPFAGMTEEEIIEELRKTRKKLWDSKFATRT